MKPISKEYQYRLDVIREALGPAAIELKGALVYQRDCLSAMKMLPAGIVDLTVTSPPYNIGKEYEAKTDVATYVDWCVKWIAEIYRLSQSNAAFWLNVGYLNLPEKARCLPIPYLLWDKTPFFLIQEIIWNYGAGVAARRNFSPRNEKFLWFVKNQLDYVFNLDNIRDPNVKYPNQKKNGKLKCNPLGKNPTDVWEIPKITSGKNRSSAERTSHPAQFPIAIANRIIRGCAPAQALILDPFAGSGTSAVAALRAGYISLNFELEPKYIKIIESRLTGEVNDLFAADVDQSYSRTLPQQTKFSAFDLG
ncbi:site-specific DNA-methyltransferase [Nevskia sp.]|uniref:DNA-methyltransferase n=1 Tax=Nevskia sp. TaxID=1929292 RepID=UPI0025F0C284|nr:site-specific DNA-methyltransferase [Nevskia sp.]